MSFRNLAAALLLCSATVTAATAARAQDVPAPGTSPRIDAIRKAGALRVGVLANAPWLVENTSGSQGEAWNGPAWTLAKEYARRLDVKLEPVPVSHETKVPVLAANQVDMTISPLAETPERQQVVDFVIYSSTSVCMFGLASNPKFAKAATVDDLDTPDITIAYYTGGGEEGWVKERFKKAKLRGVTGSGTAPVEEIMAKRADAAPINRVPYVPMARKVKGLAALPKENNCQDSTEKANPVGIAVDKNQAAYLEWLRAVEKSMEPQLRQEEQRVVATMQ
ncbi:MAG TPA: transporter substrate-binding domain-containing protein [Stellaceae bacterium]|jgi:polar amino acid transport system substrate-binding protein